MNQDLDIADVQNQINDYKQSIIQSLEQDHQNQSIPCFNQISQTVHHFGMLADHILQKVEFQATYVEELTFMKSEFEQKLLESNSGIQTMEGAIKSHEQREKQLEADCVDFENQTHHLKQRLEDTNRQAKAYMDLNNDLQAKIQKSSEKQQKEEKVVVDQCAGQLEEAQKQIEHLVQNLQDKEDQEPHFKAEIDRLTAENQEWLAKTEQMFIQIQQDQIMKEKNEYERELEFNEMANENKEQKNLIKDLNQQIQELKMAEAIEVAQRQFIMTDTNQRNSEVSNATTGLQSYMANQQRASHFSPNGESPEKFNQIQIQEMDEHDLSEFTPIESPLEPTSQKDTLKYAHDIQNPNSAAGSFISHGISSDQNFVEAEDIDQEYRSNGSDGDEINVDFNQIASGVAKYEEEADDGVLAEDGIIKIDDMNMKEQETSLKDKNIGPLLAPIQENPLAEMTDAEEEEELPTVDKRRDPEEEFFILSVLALKMQHTEDYDAEYIYDITPQDLYLQVKKEKLPFHKWYNWLETRFQDRQNDYKLKQAAIKIEEQKLALVERAIEPSPQKTPEKAGGLGIFDKIFGFWNRDTPDDKVKQLLSQKKQHELTTQKKSQTPRSPEKKIEGGENLFEKSYSDEDNV